MQQLTLQFDGFAPIGQSIDVTPATKERKIRLSDLSIGYALRQQNPARAVEKVFETVRLYALATLSVMFGFSLMFLAAIIGG
ncbi:MAG: hypothetical protein IJ868_00565 [Prevotella sp.]|nr:hypothetical protein [Prevotella sp.]